MEDIKLFEIAVPRSENHVSVTKRYRYSLRFPVSGEKFIISCDIRNSKF
jgi:hypothetical protein